ncbi:hypothetical protein TVAG_025110 [Trichomonas vaginalis G3]|uniref:Uncharacterized protein n=1 Tax=Trichomonas vaginalis (strain ATCC PRA-98 / G3) TaxID=412133 RepID=A2FCU4_TRIV3|nr:hypothetical protein TVAGG3_0203480 [Trichomonas vaginalis G3]EAX97275.1 hypothetical protein TVAG_025110 [Trichomonas vaginalis G3]KAI5550761.1 hypothetical protein TVAGG3_0203480 [Trichomonas vaginalis G3]|eukprot:XP_001310205.1 hypothetical protein [Trichomonas vaginalis G3]
MLLIYAYKSLSADFENCKEYCDRFYSNSITYHNFTIPKDELICIKGNYIFSSDKKFKARTQLFDIMASKATTTQWIEDPIAVTGGVNINIGVGHSREASTEIVCLEDLCNFTAIHFPYTPTIMKAAKLERYDHVTISSKTKGEMKLYNYNSLKNKSNTFTGRRIVHYGIIVQDGKPEIRMKPDSELDPWTISTSFNHLSFVAHDFGWDSNKWVDVEIYQNQSVTSSRRLYLQDYQLTLNPEGGLYKANTQSYEFETFTGPLHPLYIVLIVAIIITILSVIGCVLCCVCCTCCCCHGCCANCMPCCVLSKSKEDAEPQV